MELGVIVATQRREEQVVSPIFLQPQEGGGYRMVLNLKDIDAHIPFQHFQMGNFEQAIRMVHAGDYLASVVHRHAFYMVGLLRGNVGFMFSVGGHHFPVYLFAQWIFDRA